MTVVMVITIMLILSLVYRRSAKTPERGSATLISEEKPHLIAAHTEENTRLVAAHTEENTRLVAAHTEEKARLIATYTEEKARLVAICTEEKARLVATHTDETARLVATHTDAVKEARKDANVGIIVDAGARERGGAVPAIGGRPSVKELNFLGSPIDFIGFNGLDGDGEVSIKFIEVKSGKSKLNKNQTRVKEAVIAKRIQWIEARVEELKIPNHKVREIVNT